MQVGGDTEQRLHVLRLDGNRHGIVHRRGQPRDGNDELARHPSRGVRPRQHPRHRHDRARGA